MIANYWVKESNWKVSTSAGGEGSFTTPGVKVGVAATGGAIWIRDGERGRLVKLTYGGVGATAGFRNLVPCPINFSFSMPAMTSRGTIYKLPAAGKTLSLDEFKGGFVAFQLSGDVGAGWTQAAIFMGGDYPLASATGPLVAMALLATSKAFLWFGGMSSTLLPGNLGTTAHLGRIH